MLITQHCVHKPNQCASVICLLFSIELMDRNNVSSMIEAKKSGFVTTSLITYIGSLLNAPLTVSGFIRGVDKYSPNTTLDMDSIRKFYTTVHHCILS